MSGIEWRDRTKGGLVVMIDGERVTLANARSIALRHRPDLRAEARQGGGGTYWLTRGRAAAGSGRSGRSNMWFSEGHTERHAWLDACRRIAEVAATKGKPSRSGRS